MKKVWLFPCMLTHRRLTALAHALLCALCSVFCGHALAADADAEADAAKTLKADVSRQVFFSGNTTSFNRALKSQSFSGDVVGIGAGMLIGADTITLDQAHNVMDAQGNVVIMSRGQLFLGKTIHYNMTTSDLEITQAVMISNDPVEIQRIQHQIFGFSHKEMEFEEARSRQLAQVEDERFLLRQLAIAKGQVDDEMVGRYSLLLERSGLITQQGNPALEQLPPERRETVLSRRAFWQQSQKSALAMQSTPILSVYLRVEGDTLQRLNGNDYSARNALLTPCKCDQDETPAWAFRAEKLAAQIGGYADLTDAVLEIKGVPVLYLPQIKLPLKEHRQSGFLLPSAAFDRVSGTTLSQPVYFDLGPNQDATATTDFYENRGTRFGLELRRQQREYSGWEMHAEGIRDALWLQQLGVRQSLGEMYQSGLLASRQTPPPSIAPLPGQTAKEYTRSYLERPDFWAQSGVASNPEQQIKTYMAIPRNTWRGSYNWSGMTFLAPRLSVVSAGELTSDHRYTEELYIPDSFNQAFFGGRSTKAFATAKLQSHLDGKDFYAGVGTRYADNFLTNQRFEGQQLPAHVKLQSRLIELTPDRFFLPVYAQLSAEDYQISQANAGDNIDPPVDNLGGGSWRRLKVNTTTPLVTDGTVQISQFNSFESRYITHSSLPTKSSEIRSWDSGLEFRLPIDGKGVAPAWLRSTACDSVALGKNIRPPECPMPGDGKLEQHLHHVMDWRLRASTRPVVVKRGPYTEAAGHNLSYFASDVYAPLGGAAQNDRDVADQDRMAQSQRIALITDQSWSLLGRNWRRLNGALPDAPDLPNERPIDKARRELMAGLNQAIDGATSMYDESTQRWLIDRFKLTDVTLATPLSLHSDIAYDFLDAKARRNIQAENEGVATGSQKLLPEAWKPVNTAVSIAVANWSLAIASAYNIYRHAATSESILLGFPRQLKSSLSLGYNLSNSYVSNDATFQQTIVRSLSVDTDLIPAVSSFIRLNRRTINGLRTDYTTSFQTAYGLKYVSSSDCWGLQFAREKGYSTPEANASYVIRLSIVFMGQERPLPDMSGSVVREPISQRNL